MFISFIKGRFHKVVTNPVRSALAGGPIHPRKHTKMTSTDCHDNARMSDLTVTTVDLGKN